MHRAVLPVLACIAAAALPVADAFTGPAPVAALRLRNARVVSGTPVSMKAAGDSAQVRKAMAAALASVVLAAPLGEVQPVFAQDGGPAAVVKADKADAKETGGVQNWRYSEFMTAVSHRCAVAGVECHRLSANAM